MYGIFSPLGLIISTFTIFLLVCGWIAHRLSSWLRALDYSTTTVTDEVSSDSHADSDVDDSNDNERWYLAES